MQLDLSHLTLANAAEVSLAREIRNVTAQRTPSFLSPLPSPKPVFTSTFISRPYDLLERPTQFGAPVRSSFGAKHPHYLVRRNLADLMASVRDTFLALHLGPDFVDINGLIATSEWYSNGELVSVGVDITFSKPPDGGDPEYMIEFKRVQGPRFQASDMAFQIAQGLGLEPRDAKSSTAHFFSGPRYA
jgi:hypothetical protein